MRLTILIPLFAFTFVLHLAATAAVPLKWTVETSRATPAQFEAYQGETLALEAALQSYGKPLEASGIAALYWQTNGMGSAYWEATAAVNSNRLSAVWTPEMDVGAKSYNCFIGVPGTVYHAAFQLRLRPSPGADPNTLPLPVPVIDFAKVRVLNPPWEGGGGGGVNTNAVIDIIHKTVDGAARPLPKYLHLYNADDSYPDAAAEYYRSRGDGKVDGGCSSVRDGGFLYRNFDYPFDNRAEFVVKMSAGPDRFASVGVAQVGTNLTESLVTSGKHSPCYKWLPGATVDGINEHGMVAEINVVDGDPQTSGWHTTGDLHPLAAVRWALDHATNAQHAATYLAANIRFPEGWQQNFHYMIADERETWIVEDGHAVMFHEEEETPLPVLTNLRVLLKIGFPSTWRYTTGSEGPGRERFDLLMDGASITNAWYTLAYSRDTNPPWYSEFDSFSYEDMNRMYFAWESFPREAHRGESFAGTNWWQTVHTSIYDITNRVLRVAVQETDDWYTFAVGANGVTEVSWDNVTGKPVIFPPSHHTHMIDDISNLDHWLNDIQATATRAESLAAGVKYEDLPTKLDKTDVIKQSAVTNSTPDGKAADAKDLKEQLAGKLDTEYQGMSLHKGTISFTDSYYPNINFNDFVMYCNGGFETQNAKYYDDRINAYNIDISFPYAVGVQNPTFALISDISATNPAFSNAVLSVATGISTNDWAAIASVADWASVIPGGVPTGAGTLGAVLAALAATVLALKKKTSLLENDGKASNDFATDLLEKQVAINALHYALYSVPTTGADANKLKDRAVNAFALSADSLPSIPAQVNGYARDFLMLISSTYAGEVTLWQGITTVGDTITLASGKDYLIAATEIAVDKFYLRSIEIGNTPAA